MADVKLTKNELRAQQLKYERLRKYLPTLQLKKAMLQTEVNNAQVEIEQFRAEFTLGKKSQILPPSHREKGASIFFAVEIKDVQVAHENIAGVDIPLFEKVHFEPSRYSLFDTPLWFESAIVSDPGADLHPRKDQNLSREKASPRAGTARSIDPRQSLREDLDPQSPR